MNATHNKAPSFSADTTPVRPTIYFDTQGHPRTLAEMCAMYPEWAAQQIQGDGVNYCDACGGAL